MLTPFSSGVTPTASLKTNSSDQRMSPAFAGAQPLADSQTQAATALPVIGLEPEALLVNVKPETATALNQTVLQTLAAVVAARMGVERLPDELLEAFFIRLAAAIEKKPLIEQGRIEARAGLKALQIPLSDLAPALRDPSGPVAARLTARAEAPMAAPQKTAADGITDSYLQTGSTPARSAETVAMGERNKLSIDSGNLLFQSAGPKTGETGTDNASQTQFRTLFAPDAAGFERDAPIAASTDDLTTNITVARRGAGPAANGQDGLSAAGPDLPLPDGQADDAIPTTPAMRPAVSASIITDQPDVSTKPEFASDVRTPQTAPGRRSEPQPSNAKPTIASSEFAPDLAQRRELPEVTPKPSMATTKPDAGQASERVTLPDAPPLDPLAKFADKAEDTDLQRRLFRMLTQLPSTSEDGSVPAGDFENVVKGRNALEPKDMAAMADPTETLDVAAERSSRSRDVIGSTLLPSATTTPQTEAAQRATAAPHIGVPFGYVTTPPTKEAFEAAKAEGGERRRGDEGSSGENAEDDAETPEERRERLAREAVERLLQPEADAAPAVTLTRDSSESDRAFAYYQRLAGF